MAASAALVGRSHRSSTSLLVRGTSILAAGGAALSVWLILFVGGGHVSAPRAEADEVGVSFETSFGIVAVEFVEKTPGLSARQLSGMTHGTGNLVPAGKVQVQVSATMTNLMAWPIAYDPRRFVLRDEGGRPLAAQETSVQPGTLQPDASIDIRLSFVAPGNGSQLWLEFADPGGPQPVRIDLGRTQVLTGGDGHGH